MSGTGDTPLPPGAPPRHVDTSGEISVEPQGDRPLPGYVGPVEVYDRPHPTADELRATGYVVADTAFGPEPGDRVPGLYFVDTPTPPGQIRSVDEPAMLPPERARAAVEAPPAVQQEEAQAAMAPIVPAGDESPRDPDYEAGRAAAEAGEPRTANPHDGRNARGRIWLEGWKSARPENGTEG